MPYVSLRRRVKDLNHEKLRAIHAAIAVHAKEMDQTLVDLSIPRSFAYDGIDLEGMIPLMPPRFALRLRTIAIPNFNLPPLCEVTPTQPFLMWPSLAYIFS